MFLLGVSVELSMMYAGSKNQLVKFVPTYLVCLNYLGFVGSQECQRFWKFETSRNYQILG